MENELIAALKSEDGEQALYKILDMFSGYVCTVLRNFSGGSLSAEDTEELCFDVFRQLWFHRENLHEDVGLKPYLSVCAKNAVRNRFRSLNSHARDAENIDDIEELLPSEFSIERTAELNEMMTELHKAVKTLSAEEQEIFLRYFFYGEKTAAIAKMLGINENTARSKLSRARGKLKEFLIDRGYDHV